MPLFIPQWLISPEDCLPIETFVLWAMVVVGGRGNVTGIIVGTILVQFLYVAAGFSPILWRSRQKRLRR